LPYTLTVVKLTHISIYNGSNPEFIAKTLLENYPAGKMGKAIFLSVYSDSRFPCGFLGIRFAGTDFFKG
jgi:hypothetical protein